MRQSVRHQYLQTPFRSPCYKPCGKHQEDPCFGCSFGKTVVPAFELQGLKYLSFRTGVQQTQSLVRLIACLWCVLHPQDHIRMSSVCLLL